MKQKVDDIFDPNKLLQRVLGLINPDLHYINLANLIELELKNIRQLIKYTNPHSLAQFLFQLYFRFVFETNLIKPPDLSKIKTTDELTFLYVYFDKFTKIYNDDLLLIKEFFSLIDIENSVNYDFENLLRIIRTPHTDLMRIVYDFMLIFCVPGTDEDVVFLDPKQVNVTYAQTLEGLYKLFYSWPSIQKYEVSTDILLKHLNNLNRFMQVTFQYILDTGSKDEVSIEAETSFQIIKSIFTEGGKEVFSIYLLQTLANFPAQAYEFIIDLKSCLFANDPFIDRAINDVFKVVFPVQIKGSARALENINEPLKSAFFDSFSQQSEFRYHVNGSLTKCSIHSVISGELWALSCIQQPSEIEIQNLMINFPEIKSPTPRLSLYFFKFNNDDELDFFEFISGALHQVEPELQKDLYKIIMFCVFNQKSVNQLLHDQEEVGKTTMTTEAVSNEISRNVNTQVLRPPWRWRKPLGRVIQTLDEASADSSNFESPLLKIHKQDQVKFILENIGVSSSHLDVCVINVVSMKSHAGNIRWYLDLQTESGASIRKVMLQAEWIQPGNALDGWLELSGKNKKIRIYINYNDGLVYISNKSFQSKDFSMGPRSEDYLVKIDRDDHRPVES